MERLAQRMSRGISGRIDNPKPEPKVKIIVAKTAATTILLAKLVISVAKNMVMMIKTVGERPLKTGRTNSTIKGLMPVGSEVKIPAKGMTKHMVTYISQLMP